jgi:hypothetical protein
MHVDVSDGIFRNLPPDAAPTNVNSASVSHSDASSADQHF